jgi:hypothetical protein
MASAESRPSQTESASLGVAQMGWYAFAVFLVLAGLLLSARAGDDYMAVSGMLFAGFGLLLAFRLLGRSLP